MKLTFRGEMKKMNPKTSQRPSLRSSQGGLYENAIKSLCEYLQTEKKRAGQIKPPNILSTIKESLRNYRKSTKSLEASLVAEIISTLENDGNEICSRLDPEIFCVIIEIILQTEPCLDSERVVYLLAASLFRDSNVLRDIRKTEKRKDSIGKSCLQQLLDFFQDNTNPDCIRRWVGILSLQLFQNSPHNRDRIEMGAEDTRRGIGRTLVDDPNEIIKMICGQLVRVLHKDGIELQHLWPVDAKNDLYKHFPSTIQSSIDWGPLFQKWVDAVYEKYEAPDQTGQWFPGGMTVLTPHHVFGASIHNVYMWIDKDTLSIIAPSCDNHMDEIMDVPLVFLKNISVIETQDSQIPIADVIIDLVNKGVTCYLNAKAIKLERIQISVRLETAESIKGALIESYSKLDNFVGVKGLLRTLENQQAYSQRSAVCTIIGGGKMPVLQGQAISNTWRDTSEADIIGTTQITGGAVKYFQNIDGTEDSPPDDCFTGPQASAIIHNERFLTESRIKSGAEVTNGEVEDEIEDSSEDVAPTLIRSRNFKGIKPKAKPPIIPIKIALKAVPDSQVELPQSAPGAVLHSKSTKTYSIPKKNDTRTAVPSRNKITEVKSSAKVSRKILRRKTFEEHCEVGSMADPNAMGPFTAKVIRVLDKKVKSVATPTNDERANNNEEDRNGTKLVERKLKKRHSLPTLSLSKGEQPEAVHDDIFDFPIESGEELPRASAKMNPSESLRTAQKVKPATKSSLKVTRSNAKTRQPTLAAFSRNSQRTAAIKARSRISQVKNDEDEDEVEISNEITSGAYQTRDAEKGKRKVFLASMTQPVTSRKQGDKEAVEKVIQSLEEDSETQRKQHEDACALGLIQEDIFHTIEDDNLYDATPKRPLKFITAEPAPDYVKGGRYTTTKSSINSSLDMAVKLGRLLGDCEVEETIPNAQIIGDHLDAVIDARQSPPSKPPGSQNYHQDLISTTPRKEKACSPITSISLQPMEQLKQAIPETELSDNHTLAMEQNSTGLQSLTATSAEKLKTSSRSLEPDSDGLKKVLVHAKSNLQAEAQKKSIESRARSHEVQTPVTGQDVLRCESIVPGLDEDVQVEKEIRIELLQITAANPKKITISSDEKNRKRKAGDEKMREPSKNKLSSAGQPQVEKRNFVQPNRAVEAESLSKEADEGGDYARTSVSQLPTRPCSTEIKAQISMALEYNIPDRPGLDEARMRKPCLISFGPQGPKNQGQSSPSRNPTKQYSTPWKNEMPVHNNSRKRKPDKAHLAASTSPPRKRQSTSPEGGCAMNDSEVNNDSNISIPPVPTGRSWSRPRRSSRPSSQASRVNKNGSPIAATTVDHFSKAKEKLANNNRLVSKKAMKETVIIESTVATRLRGPLEVFGPKAQLEIGPKARPSSPHETASKYVAHVKTRNGHYEKMITREVITPKVLPDPFTGNNQKLSSGFTESLRKGVCNERQKPVFDQEDNSTLGQKRILNTKDHPPNVRNAQAQLQLPHMAEEWNSYIGWWPAAAEVVTEDPEKTLVNIENPHSKSLEDDTATGFSYESESAQRSRTPISERKTPNDVLNIAINRHYFDLHKAVHRIADEVLIRLSGEENRMGFLVKQYKKNGTALLQDLNQKHEKQRRVILRGLDEKREEMTTMYTEAKNHITAAANAVKENPVGEFEEEWKKTQEGIRKQISEGRMVSE